MGPFKVVVCVKQVPETTDVKIDPVKMTLIREGVPAVVNPLDLYAVEEALRIREKWGGTVTVVSMGPPQAESALKECIALGADEAILLTDRAYAGADTWATSNALAAALKKAGFDIILCGKQATDGDTAQVGPGIAAFLDIPHVTYVRKIEMGEGTVTVERLIEGGYETVRATLPALVTVIKEINVPRLPSLKGKIRAKNVQVPIFTAESLGLDPDTIGLMGSPTEVVKVLPPAMRSSGEMLAGDPDSIALQLNEKLKAVMK
jgi:electron transfer flavoprotein beta subunit